MGCSWDRTSSSSDCSALHDGNAGNDDFLLLVVVLTLRFECFPSAMMNGNGAM
jgi:hypothetical protein